MNKCENCQCKAKTELKQIILRQEEVIDNLISLYTSLHEFTHSISKYYDDFSDERLRKFRDYKLAFDKNRKSCLNLIEGGNGGKK